jgi:hypothetical protein
MSEDGLRSAWSQAGERLAELGARPAAQGGELEEWIEHAADQAVAWLGWEVLHADPTRPAFHRQNDLVTQWGGPNADNVYRHARIEPGRRYRIRGRMHSCEEFLLAVRAGFMHQAVWGTLETFTATEHGIGPGDEFELFLGGDDPESIPLPEGAVMISVREYYYEWAAEEPATFTIECLDPEPPFVSLLASRLGAALDQVQDSLGFWDGYLQDNRSKRTDNSFALDTVTVAKGLSNARYEFCFWDLEPHQALIVESAVPEAPYWGIQLYQLGTFELVDPWRHISSRNHSQTRISADGSILWVLSPTDPGVSNWLDTAGRRAGLCTLRWFWPTGDAVATPTTRVVPIADLVDLLPSDTPAIGRADRAAELAARQDHLRWRFRT